MHHQSLSIVYRMVRSCPPLAQVWTTSTKQKFAFSRKTRFFLVEIKVSAYASPSRIIIACDESFNHCSWTENKGYSNTLLKT